MNIKINPGTRMYEVKGRQYFALGVQPPKSGAGITGVIVDHHMNIVSEQAHIPGVGTQELLLTEPSLEALSQRVEQDPFNIFLIEAGGAGHNATVWPFNNRHNGLFVPPDKVAVEFNGAKVLIDANWPPRDTGGAGWGTEPSRAIHGFGYRMPVAGKMTAEAPTNLDTLSIFGETNVSADQWLSPLLIRHTISLKDGVLTRILRVTNTGDKDAPFAGGEHPDWAIPEGQPREDVLLGIPAGKLVNVDTGSLLPDLSKNPFVPVEESHLGHLFQARNKQGLFRLGDTFIDQCFVVLEKNVPVRLIFPALGWGISVGSASGCSPSMINALQVYAPKDPAEVAFELQGNAPDPFNSSWENFDEISYDRPFVTGSGLRIIKPGRTVTWAVEHRIIN